LIGWFITLQQNQPIRKYLEIVQVWLYTDWLIQCTSTKSANQKSDACYILVQSTNQNALTHAIKGRVWPEFIIRCPTMIQALENLRNQIVMVYRETIELAKTADLIRQQLHQQRGRGCGRSCSGVGQLCRSSCWRCGEEGCWKRDSAKRWTRRRSHSLIRRGRPDHPHRLRSS